MSVWIILSWSCDPKLALLLRLDSHDERNLSAMISDRDCLSAELSCVRNSTTGPNRFILPVAARPIPGDSTAGNART